MKYMRKISALGFRTKGLLLCLAFVPISFKNNLLLLLPSPPYKSVKKKKKLKEIINKNLNINRKHENSKGKRFCLSLRLGKPGGKIFDKQKHTAGPNCHIL